MPHSPTPINASTLTPMDYYWTPVGENTPRGETIQLKGSGGVPMYGKYNGDKYFTHWAKLPKDRKQN